MRIAFVSIMGNATWAACEELWAAAAAQALADGHQVLVSIYDRSATTPQITALRQRGALIDQRSTNRWVRKSTWIARLFNTFESLARFDADTVCISQGGTYDIGRSGDLTILRNLLQRQRVPYVLLCHCQQDAPRRARKQRAHAALSGAAILGMLARNLHALSEKHLGASLSNVRIFQNPLKLRNFACRPWPLDAELRMAFVGRLEHIKGLDLLIDVLATSIWSERNWHLTVCGAGEDRAMLEQRAAAAGLAERITFAGFVTDIGEVWQHHQVLVMPSRFEGIPIALTEAMLHGRPVVATDVGGIREALVDGQSGFLINHAVIPEVAAALERMWAQRTQLESMGQNAFALTMAALDPNPGATLVQWLTTAAHLQGK